MRKEIFSKCFEVINVIARGNEKKWKKCFIYENVWNQ